MRPTRRSLASSPYQDRGLIGLQHAIATSGATLVSSDIFDTVLLRDASTETSRLAEGAALAAAELGLNPSVLAKMRWNVQQSGYGAVAVERPEGEATLAAMVATLGTTLGLDADGVEVLRTAELEADAGHLRPNLPLLRYYAKLRSAGIRVIALSDIYYSVADVEWLLRRVVGSVPFDEVYVSSELGSAKHIGNAFEEVIRREGVDSSRVVHVGDSASSDVVMARRAGLRAVHVPRSFGHRARRRIRTVADLPLWLQRMN